MNKTFIATIAFAFALTAPVSADVITTGIWSPTPIPDLELNKSEDDCAIGPHMCAALWFLPPGTEQLTGGFGYTDWPGGTFVGQLTDYTDAPGLSYDGLTFTYDNGRGFISSSWDGTHQRLYRQGTMYWLFIEDLPTPIIFDYNDYMVRWDDAVATIPEPTAMLLVGLGLLACTRRGRPEKK